MLYFLGQLGDSLAAFNVFRYITFRTAGAMITALFFVFMFGPGMIALIHAQHAVIANPASSSFCSCTRPGVPTRQSTSPRKAAAASAWLQKAINTSMEPSLSEKPT